MNRLIETVNAEDKLLVIDDVFDTGARAPPTRPRSARSMHRRRRESDAARLEGEKRFRAIVADLEEYLSDL